MKSWVSGRSALSRALLCLPMALAALPLGALQAVPVRASTFDPAAAEQQLVTLINQDRAQNGLPALVVNATLSSIARGAPHQVCGNGQTLHGRSQDMVERNYFAHEIPPCNSYVWPIITSFGVQWSSAGENIGWNNYSPQATSVDQMNTAFMNSSGHRANILGGYNQVGVGAFAAPGPWSSGGTSYDGVVMYTEVFVNGPVSQPPPPPPPPSAQPTVKVSPSTVRRGSSVSVTWAGVARPATGDWLGLYRVGSSTRLVKKLTGGAASGSTPLTVPAFVATGGYEVRLYSSAGQKLATSNQLTVTR